MELSYMDGTASVSSFNSSNITSSTTTSKSGKYFVNITWFFLFQMRNYRFYFWPEHINFQRDQIPTGRHQSHQDLTRMACKYFSVCLFVCRITSYQYCTCYLLDDQSRLYRFVLQNKKSISLHKFLLLLVICSRTESVQNLHTKRKTSAESELSGTAVELLQQYTKKVSSIS